MTDQPLSRFARLRRWGNRLFILIVLTAIVFSLGKNWSAVQSFGWRIQPLGVLLAILVYSSFFLIRGVAWVWTINLLNVPLSYQVGLRTYLYTYASRYIPGGIWLFVTLNATAHSLGQSKRIFTLAFMLNIFLLAFVDIIYFTPFIYEMIGIIGVLVYGASIYTIPFWLRYGLGKFSRFKLVPESTNLGRLTQSRNVFRLFNVTVIHQVLQLVSYFIFISSMIALDTSQITYITIAYGISWLLGFLVIIVPQGLGIREVAFIVLTAPLITSEVAVALSVALRLLTIVSELTVFFLMLGYDHLPPDRLKKLLKKG